MRASFPLNQSVATRRCTPRKYNATAISNTPFTANTPGAENIGTSQPVNRFPIGMPPRKAKLYTLITRPRMSLVVISCTSEFTSVNTEINDTPDINSIRQLNQIELESANPEIAAPRQVSITSAIRPLCFPFPSHATVSAPAIEPTPEAHRKNVNVAGPRWKIFFAKYGRNVIIGTPSAVMQNASTISPSIELCLRMKVMPCFIPTRIDSVVFCG